MSVMNRHITNKALEQIRLGFNVITEARGTRLCRVTKEPELVPLPCATFEIDQLGTHLIVQLIERGDEVQVLSWMPCQPLTTIDSTTVSVIQGAVQVIQNVIERYGRSSQWELEKVSRTRSRRVSHTSLVQMRDIE